CSPRHASVLAMPLRARSPASCRPRTRLPPTSAAGTAAHLRTTRTASNRPCAAASAVVHRHSERAPACAGLWRRSSWPPTGWNMSHHTTQLKGIDMSSGKTTLREYLAGEASGWRLACTAVMQSEMELPFAALHQLSAPMLDELQGLPVPQRYALRDRVRHSRRPRTAIWSDWDAEPAVPGCRAAASYVSGR